MKIKIDVWSDIMCPFCYIGKRKLEQALEKFPHKSEVKIQWRSYQLAPDMVTDTSKSIYEYLAAEKGWTLEYSRQVHAQMVRRAAEEGLEYNFDRAIPSNSFNAHRLSQLALEYNLQDEAEERLFSAYFTEGKNIDDEETLILLGKETGLPEDQVRDMMSSDRYASQVQDDIQAAREIGVQGVPFFVLNDKYAISGAQPEETFLNALYQAWQETGKQKAGHQ